MSLCDIDHCWNVANFQHRVRQSFDVEDLGVGLDGCFVGCRISHISHGCFNAKAREFFGHETVRTAIDVGGGNHMVAGTEKRHQGGRNCRHSRGKCFCVFPAFHSNEFLCCCIRVHGGKAGVEQGVLCTCGPSSIAFISEFVG